MAVTAPVSLGTYASTGNVTTSGAVALSAGASVGELVLVAVAAGGTLADNAVALSDSQGNTWSLIDALSTTGTATTTYVFGSVLTTALVASDTITVTRTPTGGLAWSALRLPGADGTTPEIQTNVATVNDATLDTPSVSAAIDSATILFASFSNSVTAYTVGGSMTGSTGAVSSGTGNPRQIAIAYKLSSLAETVSPALTFTTGNSAWAAIAVEFSPTGASSPGTMTATAGDATASGGTANLVGGVASPSVAIIGDSLTYRADDVPANSRETLTRSRFTTAGWAAGSVYWWGRGGKNMHAADSGGKTVAQNITDARTQMGTTGVTQWVIALGTNDVADGETTFRAEVSAILDLIYDAGSELDECYWLTYTAMNAANTNYLNATAWLRAEIAARTDVADRTHIIEWAAHIHQPGVYDDADWLPSDVPHMTPQGYEKRDDFIIANLLGEATMLTTAGDAAAAGGSTAMSGGATMTATTGDATADGGTAAMSGAAGATITVTTGTGSADGGTAALTGAAALVAVAAEANATGGIASMYGAGAPVVGNPRATLRTNRSGATLAPNTAGASL